MTISIKVMVMGISSFMTLQVILLAIGLKNLTPQTAALIYPVVLVTQIASQVIVTTMGYVLTMEIVLFRGFAQIVPIFGFLFLSHLLLGL
jgi:hypothetical protein